MERCSGYLRPGKHLLLTLGLTSSPPTPPVARPPRRLLQCARSGTQLKNIGVVGNGITRALAVAIRKKTLILSDTDVVSVHKTILCFIVRRVEILFRQCFDTVFPCHTPLARN